MTTVDTGVPTTATMPPPPDGGGFDARPYDPFDDCEGLEIQAESALAPVDIIWVVDSSGSMENDLFTVQQNLDGFATFMASQGVDFHVVLVTSSSDVTPSPLFSSDPRFRFVNQHVSSRTVFARALDQFGRYADFLRPSALTHVVGVTDDDDEQSATSFITAMTQRLGHAFTFHAIAATAGPFGFGCVRPGQPLPAQREGTQYFAAARATGGREFSICTADWSGLFTQLAQTVSVTTPLPCAFELPIPPAGMTFDRSKVNVEYSPPTGGSVLFFHVEDEAACGTSTGWYYDLPTAPTTIHLCASACSAIGMASGGVRIRLGCETQLM